MRQLWCCGFCSHRGESGLEVQVHEDGCFLNPTNRGCHTCHFYESNFSDIFGEAPSCAAERSDFRDIEEDELPCDSWEPEV